MDGAAGVLDDWLAAWLLVWPVYLAGLVTLTERAGAPRPKFEIKYTLCPSSSANNMRCICFGRGLADCSVASDLQQQGQEEGEATQCNYDCSYLVARFGANPAPRIDHAADPCVSLTLSWPSAGGPIQSPRRTNTWTPITPRSLPSAGCQTRHCLSSLPTAVQSRERL